MACSIHITSITATTFDSAGNPTRIVMVGTSGGCTKIVAGISGLPQQTAQLGTGGAWSAVFSATLPVTACGHAMKVSATCTTSSESCDAPEKQLQLQCELPCAQRSRIEIYDLNAVKITPQDVVCVVPASYDLTIVEPVPAAAYTYQWSLSTDGGISNTVLVGATARTLRYTLAAGQEYTFSVSITPVDHACPVLTAAITIEVCAESCPQLRSLTAVGCAPGQVTFTATGSSLNEAERFDWTFGDGSSATGISSTIAHTYSSGGPITASVIMVAPQGCISQTAVVTVAACGNTPPIGTPDPPCSNACIASGVGIAILISALISTAAFCATPAAIAIQSAIITAAIALFLVHCGACCLYPYLFSGAALGIVATVIAAYWMGFPTCWYSGLTLLAGFVAAGVAYRELCHQTANAQRR
jgi:hypothetical protein